MTMNLYDKPWIENLRQERAEKLHEIGKSAMVKLSWNQLNHIAKYGRKHMRVWAHRQMQGVQPREMVV